MSKVCTDHEWVEVDVSDPSVFAPEKETVTICRICKEKQDDVLARIPYLPGGSK